MTTTEAPVATLVRRHFTGEGTRAYDGIDWQFRNARIAHGEKVVFSQGDVEVPSFWGEHALSILASKYFRGTPGARRRECSLRQVVDRVVDTITSWGGEDGYFSSDEERETFREELKYLIVHQMGAFNSPVWFNIGVEGVRQQASACFILSVEDTMDSILDWYRQEGLIFKSGSGSGVNLSALRGASERLTGGGTASGPVSFMRGADASAGTIRSGGKTRRAAKMVILDADHPDIESFISCKVEEEKKIRALSAAGFDMGIDGADITSVQYQNANNSVRLTDEFMEAVEHGRDWHLRGRYDGAVTKTVPARELFHQIAEAAWACADPGVQFDTTINDWHTCPASGRINASNPCSEYLHLDNSACNLASLNVLGFLDDGVLDVAGFAQACRVFIIAQDILVGRADYPTEKVGENARRFRQLGLGYANLGASLMVMGLGYESEEGRGFAAALTALMTGTAYEVSTELAGRLGAFDGYEENATAMVRVLGKHLDAALGLKRPEFDLGVVEVIDAAVDAFGGAYKNCAGGMGVRNSQVSVLAPTGTISFLMGCDTTGVEPAFGLVTYKTLVGGGFMALPVNTVEAGLEALGYSRDVIERLLAHVAETGEITGGPGLKPEHAGVFATAVGTNAVSPLGHVQMVAAVQPFLSGGVSKTVNLPADATVEAIESVFLEGWKLGVKCLAVYRDGCKASQPLSTKSSDVAKDVAVPPVAVATRTRLPRRRVSRTTQFKIGGVAGYFTVGHYDDGKPGELFLKVAKQGSTLSGILDALAISVSLGLQNGVPLVEFVRKFTHLRFEPAGLTNDEDLRFATSILDYVFSRLAVDYLTVGERADLGVFSTAEKAAAAGGYGQGDLEIAPVPSAAPGLDTSASFDGSPCSSCGSMMVRTGTCWACPTCGASGGC